MLTPHCCRANRATSQGGAHTFTSVTAQPNPDEVSAKGLARAPLTREEVADFLYLASSPECQYWADRALAYATTFDSPLDRMIGLMLAYAWLAATPSARLRRPAGRFGATG